MRVIFLDMDGVVNSRAWLSGEIGRDLSKRAARRVKGELKARAHADHERMVDMIDPAAIVHLNAILDATGAVCVLSSSWRIAWPFPAVEAALRERGFTGRIVDATPNGAPVPPEWADRPESEFWRGLEIAAWLAEHPDVTAFVILDDSADMAHLMPKLVRTSWHGGGLLAEHVEPAIALLRVAELERGADGERGRL